MNDEARLDRIEQMLLDLATKLDELGPARVAGREVEDVYPDWDEMGGLEPVEPVSVVVPQQPAPATPPSQWVDEKGSWSFPAFRPDPGIVSAQYQRDFVSALQANGINQSAPPEMVRDLIAWDKELPDADV